MQSTAEARHASLLSKLPAPDPARPASNPAPRAREQVLLHFEIGGPAIPRRSARGLGGAEVARRQPPRRLEGLVAAISRPAAGRRGRNAPGAARR